MKGLLLIMIIFASITTFSQQISPIAKASVDWGWGDNGAPEMTCASDEIAPGIIRGHRGPRTCLELAIQASRNGNDALALRWIITTQCHNAEARNSLIQAGNIAVVYLMNTYGGGYNLGTATAPPVIDLNQCNVLVLNHLNQDLEMYGIRFKIGEHINCESLVYLGTLAKRTTWQDKFPKGWNAWIIFKTAKSGPCGSSDTKYEINGLGWWATTKQYDIQ
jgi:hypothetical protein